MIRRLLFVVFLSVLGVFPLATTRAGNCSNATLSSNPGPGSVTAGTPISLIGTASCSPGAGKFQIVIFNGIVGSSDGQGSVSATWVANANYGSSVTVHFQAYASDDAAGYFPANADINFTVVAAGQPAQNNPPANNGGGQQQAPQLPAQTQDIPFVGSQNKPGGNSVQALSEPTYIYQNADTNSKVIAQVHSGWYVGMNATSPGWTQVTFNYGVGYMVDGNGQTTRSNAGAVQAPDNNPPPPSNNGGGGSNPYAVGRLGNGGLDVERICNVTGKHATNDGQHSSTWGCDGVLLDKNATCALVWPEYPYALVQGGLAGWSCHPSVQFQEQPPSANTNNGGGSSGGSSGGSGSGNTAVTCNLPTHLVTGQEGHVISSVLNLRKGTGTDFDTWITMHQGDYFSVTGNPTCRQGYNWWPASFLGYNGYIAEGINGAYYVEPSNTPAQPNQPQSPNSNVIEIPFYYGTFNTTYVFLVDVTDKTNCKIVNGTAIVAQELSRSYAFFSGVYATEETLSADIELALYLKNNGYIDNFRVNIETMLLRQASCKHSYYRINDSATMDMSGLGNVAFGFYSIVVDVKLAKGIGHLDQLVKEGKLDYPDDQSQVVFGRAIANSGYSPSSSSVEQSIPAGFISSK